MDSGKFERPSRNETGGHIENPPNADHERAVQGLVHVVRLRDQRHRTASYPVETTPAIDTGVVEPAISEVAEPAIQPVRTRPQTKLSPASGFDKPFVDFIAAQKTHPEIFQAKYDEKADKPFLQSMMNVYAGDPELMRRVETVYANPQLPKAYKPDFTDDAMNDFLTRSSMFRLLSHEEEIMLGSAIKIGVAAFKEMGSQNDFSDPILEGLAREGAYSFLAFYHTNLRLPFDHTIRIAQAFPHVEKMDILALGLTGVHVAVGKFDETKGFKFSTPAMHWIKHHIQRGLENGGRMIRLPSNKANEKRRVDKVERAYITKLKRKPTASELVEETGLTIDEIAHLGKVGTNKMTSLNVKTGTDNETELGHLVEAKDPNEVPDEVVAAREILGELFRTPDLDDIDRLILSFRHYVFMEELAELPVGGGNDLKYEDAFYDLPGTDGKPPSYGHISTLTGVSEKVIRLRERTAMEKIAAAHDLEAMYKTDH